jgi:hypothetical protein
VSDSNLFVGTYGGGVYLSTNNGMNWTNVGSGLTDTLVQSLAVCGTNLFVGTRNSGVWRRPLSEMIVAVEAQSNLPPRDFVLHQNFPNPFNPGTTIRYGLPKRSRVTLTVLNTLGQQVAFLVQGEKERGYYEVKFDASHVASGVYFYRLEAGDYTATKKLLLLR